MNWYLQVLRNYANFDGRARRKEYWMFRLFHFLIAIGILVIESLLFGIDSMFALIIIYFLGTFIPSIAVTVRRLHDIGKSGAYYFMAFIPMVGGIIMLIFLATEGENGDNRYGPDPKAGESAADRF